MDTDFNYLYEDKYYEHAVKNLKSTFYDVVEREEIMLNNLEYRIANEKDNGVKTKLLDLWSKQNDSLDQSIVLFRQLKQSVRVIDSFVKELSEIDEAIVSDIINNTNYIKSNRVEQMKRQDVIEQQAPMQEKSQEKEIVHEESVVEETPIVENVQEELINKEQPVFVTEEVVVEQPIEEKTLEIENPVSETIQEVEVTPANESNNEEAKINENVLENNENIEESIVEEQPTIEDIISDENLVQEENKITLVNEETPILEKSDSSAITASEDVAFEPSSKEDVKDLVEETDDNVQEILDENVNEKTLDVVVEEDNNTQLLIPLEEQDEEVKEKSSEISNAISIETTDIEDDKAQILENVDLPVENIEEEIHFDESFNTEEVPEMEIVNEENDGMDLPNVVEVDKIDPHAMIDEDIDIEIHHESSELVELPSTETVEKKVEKTTIDFVKPTRLGKEDDKPAKAIIVSSKQFEKLKASFKEQEKNFFTMGYFNNDIINESNQTLSGNINNEKEDLEVMIEKATDLYKNGQIEEAQALYDEITRINDSMHQQEATKLVKAA